MIVISYAKYDFEELAMDFHEVMPHTHWIPE